MPDPLKSVVKFPLSSPCSKVRFKFQCCKLVWVSWFHSKKRFIDCTIILWLMYSKVTSSLLLPSHPHKGRTCLSFQWKFKSWLCSFKPSSCLWNNFLWRSTLYESLKSLQAFELPFLLLLHQRGWWWTIFSAIVCLHLLSYSHSSSLLFSLKGV